ncbi:MAG: sigma-70 family RNA polymerase sigma factor [Phycisphaera sp.]|nr:sigma-70 family RNA polymerase sigma factor [Phycisphaera sp.]
MNDVTCTWRDLFERHGPALVLFARQWSASFADAEDVVQEAFVKMIRNPSQPDDPAAYLFTAVRHAALDQLRSAARRRGRERAVMQTRPLFESGGDDAADHEAIEAAMSRLSDEQREVVVMKVWGGLTFEAIGRVLDTSPNTVASRYRYALSAMRRTLDPEPDAEVMS